MKVYEIRDIGSKKVGTVDLGLKEAQALQTLLSIPTPGLTLYLFPDPFTEYSISIVGSGDLVCDGFDTEEEAYSWLDNQLATGGRLEGNRIDDYIVEKGTVE